MKNRMFTLFLIAILVGGVACKKDRIDLATLTSNPFDADYSGDPIFTVLSTSTAQESVGGNSVRVMTLQVRVHTELFGRPTTYQVGIGEPVVQSVASNTITNGVMAVRILPVVSGETYCALLRVGNGGTFGGGNQVCGLAE